MEIHLNFDVYTTGACCRRSLCCLILVTHNFHTPVVPNIYLCNHLVKKLKMEEKSNSRLINLCTSP
jgi:hypothetical protein